MKKCNQCGEEFPKGQLNRKGNCFGCSMENMHQCIKDMHNKSGKYYERWLAGMKKFADSVTERG